VNERRVLWLFVAVVLGQLVLLSVQAPSAGAGDNFLEGLVLRVVAPITSAVDAVGDGFGNAGENLASRRRLVAENRSLRRRVEQLELELMRLAGVEWDLERLAATLDYEPAPRGERIAADVVYVDHDAWLETLLVYVGGALVAVNQPVIDSKGLVGRVVLVASPYAKVQLITDRTAAVGAMIRRTRRQGVVRSGSEGLELDFVPLQADVRVGDRVVTSGADGIYPRGIPVGTVSAVTASDELFHVIRLEPAVELSALDQVYVLGRPPVPEELMEKGPGARP
jgi:rod shape-determining protein MreC